MGGSSQSFVHLLRDLVNRIDIFEGTGCTACDRRLINLDLAVMNLGAEIQMNILVILENTLCLFFYHL